MAPVTQVKNHKSYPLPPVTQFRYRPSKIFILQSYRYNYTDLSTYESVLIETCFFFFSTALHFDECLAVQSQRCDEPSLTTAIRRLPEVISDGVDSCPPLPLSSYFLLCAVRIGNEIIQIDESQNTSLSAEQQITQLVTSGKQAVCR